MVNDILKKLSNENDAQYIWRIGAAKADGRIEETWEEINATINAELGFDEENRRDCSVWRKRYRAYLDAYEQIFSKSNFTERQLCEQEEQKRELAKEKVKIRDERIDYQKSIREEARRESFIELIERSMAKSVEPFEYKSSPVINSKEDMIVVLSDLHAGIEVQNWWNTFNTNVLKERLHKYIDQIIDIQRVHQCKVCNVVLGGDNISGLIHVNMRLQNNENVIEQIKIATTYIGEFIHELQGYFEAINVYSVSGNHSRISPNKESHLNGEELDAMIPFCLSLQFSNNDKVVIHDDDAHIDNTIGNFTTRGGKLFYIVHGDKDTPSNVVKNLTLMTGKKPDGIIMGHRHNTALTTEHNVKVVQCGSCIGMDDYCVDRRISGSPEQSVIITNENNVVKCLYDVRLN